MILGEGLDTDLVEHLGCGGGVWGKWDSQVHPSEAEGGEEARAVAGDRGGKRETRAQNPVEWFP